MRRIFQFILLLSVCVAYSKETLHVQVRGIDYAVGDSLCFFVNLSTDETTEPSKIAYVELLAPEGYVVERKVCRLFNNHCEGTFLLSSELLSGLYELRAYTRYMLSQDKDGYPSKVLPVYEWKDGKKAIRNRRREIGTYTLSTGTSFSISPEQEPTLRGKLFLPGKKGQHADMTVTMSIDGTTWQATTDKDGQFCFALPTLRGRQEATIVYKTDGVRKKNQPLLLLDDAFSPDARAYTKADYALADSYEKIRKKGFGSWLRPDILMSTKDLMCDYLDKGGVVEVYYAGQCNPWFPIFHFAEICKVYSDTRFVDVFQSLDSFSLTPDSFEVYDNGGFADVEGSQYMLLCMDSAVCAHYSYTKYPPQQQAKNYEMRMPEKSFAATGFNHKRDGSPVPSAVVFFIPYPKGTPLAERWKNTQPNVRHAVLHGYSE